MRMKGIMSKFYLPTFLSKTLILQVLTISFISFFPAEIFSQSIFENSIVGNNPSASNPFISGQVVAEGITVSGISYGSGLDNTNGDNRFNTDDFSTNSNLNASNNDFISWTITPNSCYEVDLISLTIAYQRTGNGPQNIALRSNVDGFSTNIWTAAGITVPEQISTIDLSPVYFQNLTNAITFRLYGWNAGNDNGAFSINSFVFNGAVNSLNTAVAGTISGNSSVCSGSNTTLTLSGYTGNMQWQSSTNNTTFTDIAGATEATYTTPNLNSTTFYRAKVNVGSCPSVFTNNIAISVASGSLTASNGSACGPTSVNLAVTGTCIPNTTNINWYSNALGGNSIATGSTFSTPVLNSSTTYYASYNSISGDTSFGPNDSDNEDAGLEFNVFFPMLLNSVQVESDANGSITVQLFNSAGNAISGFPATVFPIVNGINTLVLNWNIPVGNGYQILVTNMSSGVDLSRDENYTWPIALGNFGFIIEEIGPGNHYNYFYNWNISSPRIPVVATITTGTNNTTTASACDSYTWSVNGTTYTTSGTYTSVTGCHTETLVLTITPSTNNTTTVSACDSYTWSVNGTNYTASGTYTSVTGCHTETLVLTVNISNVYYVDADGDGFGSTVTANFCAMPSTGFALNNTDCNDAVATTYPGAVELCNSVDDNCSGFIDEGCPSTIAGEEPFNAYSAPTTMYSYCNSFYGTLENKFPSQHAHSICETGEDVWYTFIAQTSGVTIFIGSYVNDIVIELQDANGTTIDVENIVVGPGTEVLTTTALIEGNEYRFAVRNKNSELYPGGQFSACVRHLRRGGSDSGTSATWPGTLSTCSLFKAAYCGGTGVQYRYVWTGISGSANGQVFTKTQVSDYLNVTAVAPSLHAGCSYNVLVTAIYSIPNGAGVNEVVEMSSLEPTTITISPVANIALRSSDQITNGPRYRGSIVAALPWVCGVTNWRWRFTEVDPLTMQAVGLPIEQNRGAASNYLNLASVTALQYGKTYAVQSAPVFTYTGTNYQWGPVKYMAIIGNAGLIIDASQDATASQDSPKDVLQDASQDFELSVYPNPSRGDALTMSISGINSENVQLKVYDALGRKIESKRFVVEGTLQTTLNFTSELSNGLYILEVNTEDVTRSVRFMVEQ